MTVTPVWLSAVLIAVPRHRQTVMVERVRGLSPPVAANETGCQRALGRQEAAGVVYRDITV